MHYISVYLMQSNSTVKEDCVYSHRPTVTIGHNKPKVNFSILEIDLYN